jgi:hypothetical protein
MIVLPVLLPGIGLSAEGSAVSRQRALATSGGTPHLKDCALLQFATLIHVNDPMT